MLKLEFETALRTQERMNKMALVLLPGLLSDAAVWEYQSHQLDGKTDIIIPNLNQADSPEKMVDAVLEVSPLHFNLAGHSMGGWLALEIMKRCPKRILKLALLNTTPLPDSVEKHEARKAMIQQAGKGNYELIIDKLMNTFIYNRKVAENVMSMFERNKLAFINQEKAMLKRGDCLAVLKHISCPTLIIHSENDANFNFSDSQLLAENIPHSTLAIIKNCGHMSPIESPKEVTELMQIWLDFV